MRIDIVSTVFPPEPVVAAQICQQFAEELVRRRHRVRVLTAFPNRPAGRLFEGYRRSLWQRDQSIADYELVRCFATLSPRSTLGSRFAENVSFGISSSLALLRGPRPEVVLAGAWPLFATYFVMQAALRRGAKVVLPVQDLYPEALFSPGRLNATSSLGRWLTAWERSIALKADRIVVCCDEFAQAYTRGRGVPAERVSVVENWMDESRIQVGADGRAIRARMGLAETDFVCLYGGNIGAAAGVPALIEAFRLMRDEVGLKLLIAGAGSELAYCQKLVAQYRLSNVSFLTPWLASESSIVLGSADVCLLPTMGSQALTSVPSKAIAYMLAGKPVLACAAEFTPIAGALQRSGCGWRVAPGDAAALAQRLREVQALPRAALEVYGAKARAYSMERHSQAVNLKKYVDLIEGVAAPQLV